MTQNAATITGSQREDALLRLNDAEWHLSRLREIVEAGGLDGDAGADALAGLGAWVLDLLGLDQLPVDAACGSARRRLVVVLARATESMHSTDDDSQRGSIDGDEDYAHLLALDDEDDELSPQPVRLAP